VHLQKLLPRQGELLSVTVFLWCLLHRLPQIIQLLLAQNLVLPKVRRNSRETGMWGKDRVPGRQGDRETGRGRQGERETGERERERKGEKGRQERSYCLSILAAKVVKLIRCLEHHLAQNIRLQHKEHQQIHETKPRARRQVEISSLAHEELLQLAVLGNEGAVTEQGDQSQHLRPGTAVTWQGTEQCGHGESLVLQRARAEQSHGLSRATVVWVKTVTQEEREVVHGRVSQRLQLRCVCMGEGLLQSGQQEILVPDDMLQKSVVQIHEHTHGSLRQLMEREAEHLVKGAHVGRRNVEGMAEKQGQIILQRH
jgi:hypothetical protein